MTRATALPPGERRAAIVEATLPLLLASGPGVTTRQIAEAAGVAEGTIFRAFPDKEALLCAVVHAAFDPGPTDAALDAIDRGLPLDERLTQGVEILRSKAAVIWQLTAAIGPAATLPAGRAPGDVRAIADLFGKDAKRLRVGATEAAQLLRGLTLAGTHPALVVDDPLPSSAIVSVLLDGIRQKGGH